MKLLQIRVCSVLLHRLPERGPLNWGRLPLEAGTLPSATTSRSDMKTIGIDSDDASIYYSISTGVITTQVRIAQLAKYETHDT